MLKENKSLQNELWNLFCVGQLPWLWPWFLQWPMTAIPSETALEKTDFYLHNKPN